MSSVASQDKKYMDLYGEGDYWPNLSSVLPLYMNDAGEFADIPDYESSHTYESVESKKIAAESFFPGPEEWPEEMIGYQFRPGEGEESEISESTEASSTPSDYVPPEKVSQDTRKRSLFVHSCPSHFSDINRARKSVFGSIFLRTTGRPAEESALLRTVTDSNFSMLQSLLNSFDKILSLVPSDSDRRQMMLRYKESILQMLENSGIRRTYSDGNIHWDIYPISQSYLFSIQIDDRVHQTRHLSKIEERIVSGTTQSLRTPYEWPTNSIWSGNWDGLGMSGSGTYTMPHGVIYSGKMKDGMFHDDNATLIYPNKFKAINCKYEKGKLKDCQFQFPDNLLHEKENWQYCKFPDRRFWSEVRKGFKPAKTAQKTELDPPRKIPAGCYDTNDGFYNPKTLALCSPNGEMLRVPVYEESMWIKKYCRKGFVQPTGYRPDLYENWYDYDEEFIQDILNQHENYRLRKITYDELQQYYADHDLLSPFSKYQKRKSPSQVDLENYMKTVPDPVHVGTRKDVKKYTGHKLSELMQGEESSITMEEKEPVATESSHPSFKKSKSFIKFSGEPKKFSNTGVNVKYSKINFKMSSESLPVLSPSIKSEAAVSTSTLTPKGIPEKYLLPQPIQRPPFQERQRPGPIVPKKCTKKEEEKEEELVEDTESKHLQKKRLQKFMKELIMEMAMKPLLEERERQKRRLFWATKVPTQKRRTAREEHKCLKILQRLHQSIPDKEEYADSDPSRTCNLSKLAEDKYNILKYWGKRLFTLEFKK